MYKLISCATAFVLLISSVVMHFFVDKKDEFYARAVSDIKQIWNQKPVTASGAQLKENPSFVRDIDRIIQSRDRSRSSLFGNELADIEKATKILQKTDLFKESLKPADIKLNKLWRVYN